MSNDPKEQTIDWSKVFAQNDNGYAVLPTTKTDEEKYPRISIGFSFTDTYGNSYTANTETEVITDVENEIDIIGEQLNAFLAQCGYIRNNGFMLMNDLTKEEVGLLTDYLDKIRNKRKAVDEE